MLSGMSQLVPQAYRTYSLAGPEKQLHQRFATLDGRFLRLQHKQPSKDVRGRGHLAQQDSDGDAVRRSPPAAGEFLRGVKRAKFDSLIFFQSRREWRARVVRYDRPLGTPGFWTANILSDGGT